MPYDAPLSAELSLAENKARLWASLGPSVLKQCWACRGVDAEVCEQGISEQWLIAGMRTVLFGRCDKSCLKLRAATISVPQRPAHAR